MPPRRAENATFSLFQATDEEFDAIFPGEAQDMELIEDFTERVGEGQALRILLPVWERPILKRDAQGIHGTLCYEYADRRRYLPASKREVDWDDSSINIAQRRLFASNAKVRNSPAAMNGPKIPRAEGLGRLVPNIPLVLPGRARNGTPLGATHRHDLDVLQSLLRELSVQAL